MLKMLVAVDGSEHAQRAIAAVTRLAPQVEGGVQAILLNVSEGMLYLGDLPPYDIGTYEQLQREAQERLLADAVERAKAGGLSAGAISTQAASGEPAEQILRVAKAQGVDQIVMGTHGRGALGSLFLGSIAQRVLHGAEVPVLLVR